jgi:hypothetical protein
MVGLLKFGGKLAVWGVLLHVVVSLGLAFLFSQTYDRRMPNVRKIDAEPAAKQSLIAAYLRDAADEEGPVTCFIGSSFTWGYPLKDGSALPAAVGNAEGSSSINASVIGAGLEVTRNTLEVAREQNLRFARIVIEIPLVNELHLRESNCSWAAFCLPTRPESFQRVDRYASSYLRRFLAHPGDWNIALNVLGDECDECDDRPVRLGKLPGRYFLDRRRFDAVREAYGRSIVATLELAGQAADEVVVFPSPIYVDGAETLGFDGEAIREQIDFTLQACRQVPGVVVVELEERHLTDPTMFANVTHFNTRGNREFGEWLATEMKQRGREPALTAGAPVSRR